MLQDLIHFMSRVEEISDVVLTAESAKITYFTQIQLRGGAGRKTVLLIFQPTHFIVHLL